MESKSIEFRDPELDESFSFRNSSSSFAIFSHCNLSDDDDYYYDDDDDQSYIEIALEPARVSDVHGCGEEEVDCDDEMELRISFSSGVLFPSEVKSTELYESVTSCASSFSASSSSAFTFSSSSTETESQRNQRVEESELCSRIMQKTIRSKVEFLAVNRFVNSFISSFRDSSEIDLANGCSPQANHLDLVASSTRKPSKMRRETAKMNSGMMMKFFIKFRALKLRTFLPPFLKAKSSIDKGKISEETIWTYNQTLMDKGTSTSLQERKQGERSRVIEMNMDAIRGVLEAMSIRSLGHRDRRRTKSYPVSTKSSPSHQPFPSDNSIQAAIAHCKRSFAPNI